MKKYSVLVFLFLPWYLLAQEPITTREHKTNWLMQQLYGPTGMQISSARFHATESLLKNLLSASPYELSLIAAQAVQKLTERKQLIEATIHSLEQAEKPIPPKIFFDRFVLETYLEHLRKYEQLINKQLSITEKIQGIVHTTYNHTKTWIKKQFTKKTSDDFVKKTAQKLVEYSDFERTNLLTDYQKVSRFLHNATHALLPPIMSFWQNNETRNSLRLRSQLLLPEVQTQFWAEIGMIALQSILMGGSSMYNGFISELDAKKFKEYSDQQQKIQDGFSEFIKQTKTDQNALRKTISTAFIASATTAAAQYQAQNQQLSDETQYLFQAINLNQPISHDLEYPPIWSDQFFEVSHMNTPKNIHWHSVFPVSGSDWEYDPDHNSFWQNGLSTFDKTDAKSAQRDHIFTEYSSKKAQYEIEVECRLINCQYPFFVGVMFNKARWISGVPERFFQCRLLGLYGTTDTTNTTSTISVCFAQQYTTKKEKDGKEISEFVTPLEQITTDAKTNLFKLNDKDRALLIKEPITFLFNITTQPNQVALTVTKKGKTNEIIMQKTIDGLNDPYLAIFGGIGFMAAGCQAEFTLIKPESLVYTSENIKNFKAASK